MYRDLEFFLQYSFCTRGGNTRTSNKLPGVNAHRQLASHVFFYFVSHFSFIACARSQANNDRYLLSIIQAVTWPNGNFSASLETKPYFEDITNAEGFEPHNLINFGEIMGISDVVTVHQGNVGKLPLVMINHVSYAVPQPQVTAQFFEDVLGFKRIKRPESFQNSFDGAWLCGMGVEIHLVQPHRKKLLKNERFPRTFDEIDPRSDHLSFLCNDMDSVISALKKWNAKYLQREFHEDKLRQVRDASLDP